MTEQTAEHTPPELTFHWYLPPFVDSRYVVGGGPGGQVAADGSIGSDESYTPDRPVDPRYLKQLALAAEQNGFESVLIPVGLWCEDPWLIATSLLDVTDRLKFLVAVRPGLATALKEAQSTSTFQRISGNRLNLNVVTGGEPTQQKASGDDLPKAQRYERTGEFLDLWKQLWTSEDPVDFDGRHVHVEGARLPARPDVIPPVYFSGSSPEALEVAQDHADIYLTWGEKPDDVGQKLAAVPASRGGLRVHVIARETSGEAWAAAERLLSHVSEEDVRDAQQAIASSESESQRRIAELHGRGSDFQQGSDVRSLEIHPGLWTGVGLVRGGAGTALVGSYEEVADLIVEYQANGVEEFVLSGYPHLEETYHVGEGVIPAVRRRGFGVTNHGGPLGGDVRAQERSA
ncbi:MAG: LLM class flavin-dependent oxidoreductase [Mycobacteriaceae bacterium]